MSFLTETALVVLAAGLIWRGRYERDLMIAALAIIAAAILFLTHLRLP